MKYIVIKVFDRQIMKIGVADTITEATKIMKDDFMNVFVKHYEKEDFENKIGYGDDWEFNKINAWLDTNSDTNYDWQIIEV